jgi:hypothetical protein
MQVRLATRSSLIFKALLLMALFSFMTCFASAQDDSKFDLSVGYAGLREGTPSSLSAIGLDHPWANGWQVAGVYNVVPAVGIEAQVNGFYKGLHLPSGIPIISSLNLGNLNVYTATFGPQVKFPHGKVEPYLHGLVGFAHGSVSTGGILSFLPIPTDLSSFNKTTFAADLGGGIDYMVIPHIGLRGEVAYVYTRFPLSDIGLASSNSQNNLKAMVGLAFHF